MRKVSACTNSDFSQQVGLYGKTWLPEATRRARAIMPPASSLEGLPEGTSEKMKENIKTLREFLSSMLGGCAARLALQCVLLCCASFCELFGRANVAAGGGVRRESGAALLVRRSPFCCARRAVARGRSFPVFLGKRTNASCKGSSCDCVPVAEAKAKLVPDLEIKNALENNGHDIERAFSQLEVDLERK